eukprot:365647-Chlamydomonas_euryale.AAC.7
MLLCTAAGCTRFADACMPPCALASVSDASAVRGSIQHRSCPSVAITCLLPSHLHHVDSEGYAFALFCIHRPAHLPMHPMQHTKSCTPCNTPNHVRTDITITSTMRVPFQHAQAV